MTGRLRRREVRARRELTSDERSFLISGHGLSFRWKSRDWVWILDEAAARAAWAAHRDELMAEQARHGLIPWAAHCFDGLEGCWSRYQHLPGFPGRCPTGPAPDGAVDLRSRAMSGEQRR
jgi:hypothetical protein